MPRAHTRRRRRTTGDVPRSTLRERVDTVTNAAVAADATRQSVLVSRRRSEREVLAFITAVVGVPGWR
jgi:hypothetical protein